MIKTYKMELPDWCDGCSSLDITTEILGNCNSYVKLTCRNLDYCTRAKAACEHEMARRKETA